MVKDKDAGTVPVAEYVEAISGGSLAPSTRLSGTAKSCLPALDIYFTS